MYLLLLILLILHNENNIKVFIIYIPPKNNSNIDSPVLLILYKFTRIVTALLEVILIMVKLILKPCIF